MRRCGVLQRAQEDRRKDETLAKAAQSNRYPPRCRMPAVCARPWTRRLRLVFGAAARAPALTPACRAPPAGAKSPSGLETDGLDDRHLMPDPLALRLSDARGLLRLGADARSASRPGRADAPGDFRRALRSAGRRRTDARDHRASTAALEASLGWLRRARLFGAPLREPGTAGHDDGQAREAALASSRHLGRSPGGDRQPLASGCPSAYAAATSTSALTG